MQAPQYQHNNSYTRAIIWTSLITDEYLIIVTN